MKKGLVKVFGLVVPSVILGLLVAEGIIRVLDLGPEMYTVQKGRYRLSENPLIGYELVPGFETAVTDPMTLFKGRANGQGFRDNEHDIEKHRTQLLLGNTLFFGPAKEGVHSGLTPEGDGCCRANEKRRLWLQHVVLIDLGVESVKGRLLIFR